MSLSPAPEVDERVALWTQVSVAGVAYLRLPLRTRWLNSTDDLLVSLKESLSLARPGDTVGVSEKVAILLTGRAVDIGGVQPGRLARMLADHVRPRTDSKGLAVPEKMEYVVRAVGLRRIILAAIGCALTRPLGVCGTFYRIAGPIARDVDGGRPPYENVLFPPLDTTVAQKICADLERALDIGVSIVDLNDFGGSIRAVSPRSLSEKTLAAVLSDNPLGQRLTSTPFVLVRPARKRDLQRRRCASTSTASASSRRSGARSAYRTPMKTASSVSPTDDIKSSSLTNPGPTTGLSRR
jgi:hypothetical protein